ncbi:LANO_0H08328g1_1 [Lachancea nothofagi CBS 11611]|uniref:LANO_0H08328g1_1 n=1 Tax=Lachancea nothofagi CBS 11611 TaxID=1266666 RepID=A0A1G4KLM9_9SACH|nr:LANO_0H08328g1_1 [Lachancea nothofagi CBS 11611]
MGLPDETNEQRDRRFHKLFNSIDIDKTGKVDLEQLTRAFQRSNHPLKKSPEAIEQMFRSLDCNNDSIVDFEDFKKYALTAESQIRQGFLKLDRYQDGKIRTSELSTYLSKLAENNEPRPEKSSTFKNFLRWAFTAKRKEAESSPYITYDQWRDFLLFMPRKKGSRLHTAYSYFYLFNEDVDLSSEGDVTLINDFIRGFGFFIAGGVSGVISRTCTAPFDRIKVFLIARTDLTSTFLNSKDSVLKHNPGADVAKIKSPLVKAATSLYRQGGIRAFYVGNGLNVIKVFPESAIKFGSFEIAKRMMAQLEGTNDTSQLSRFSTYIAGGMGGVMAQFSVYPVDTLKYRVQCAPLNAHKKGSRLMIETAKQMYRDGGLKLFYRGVTVGVTGIFPYAALDLGTFSALKKWYITRKAQMTGVSEDQVTMSNVFVLLMGAFSGTVGATLVYPINLLRTRLQAQGTYAHPYQYDGFRDVFSKTVQREGYPGLFKGLVPNLAKVCPAVSISYLCYENLKRGMKLE